MNLFKSESSYPKLNAQRNLCGRTHYVDDDTLRYHKSRVVYADWFRHGLLFAIITSDALDHQNTKRGFRYVVFDVFGNVVARTEMEQAFRRSEQAQKVLSKLLQNIDATGLTYTAIDRAKRQFNDEMLRLLDETGKIEIKQIAQKDAA